MTGDLSTMKPKFCPNCGKELIDESFHLKSFSSLIFNEGKENELIVSVKGWGMCYFSWKNWGS